MGSFEVFRYKLSGVLTDTEFHGTMPLEDRQVVVRSGAEKETRLALWAWPWLPGKAVRGRGRGYRTDICTCPGNCLAAEDAVPAWPHQGESCAFMLPIRL